MTEQRNTLCQRRFVLEKDMKAALRKAWISGAALLFALACPSNAMPPVAHKISGNTERMDRQRRELVLTNANLRTVLVWSETNPLDRTCLEAGDHIKAYYRKEAGRLVITDFSPELRVSAANEERNYATIRRQ
jgi:hypothetical protein